MEDARKNAEFTCHCVNEGTKGTAGSIFIRIRPRCDRVAQHIIKELARDRIIDHDGN